MSTQQKTKPPTWNPVTQQLDSPPTKSQMTVLRDLCDKTKVHILGVYPATSREADARIQGLMKLRKAQRRNAKRASKRAERLRARRRSTSAPVA